MSLAYETRGSGPPLVLLHGTGSYRGMWDPVVGTLARERRVIAVDLPGFAGSGAEPADPSPEGLTTYLERWFADQGLDRPHVAGNSLGGGLALELARRLLPWAQHVALRGCGHVPCHDDPEAVAAVLLAGSREG